MFTFYTMSDKDCKKYGVAEEEKRYYVRLDNAKANMTLSGGEPRWFKRIGEILGAVAGDPDSGESVGILAPVKLEEQPHIRTSLRTDKLWEIIKKEALVIGDGTQEITIDRATIKKNFDAYLVDAYLVQESKKNKPITQKAKGQALRFNLDILEERNLITFNEKLIIVFPFTPTPHASPQNDHNGVADTPHVPTPPVRGVGEMGEEMEENENV